MWIILTCATAFLPFTVFGSFPIRCHKRLTQLSIEPSEWQHSQSWQKFVRERSANPGLLGIAAVVGKAASWMGHFCPCLKKGEQCVRWFKNGNVSACVQNGHWLSKNNCLHAFRFQNSSCSERESTIQNSAAAHFASVCAQTCSL